MPEETNTAPVSSPPEPKTSVLDKNVPNPLAKNPNVHTHKVFASVALILIGTIVILSILAYFYRDQVADLFVQNAGTDKTVVTTKVSTFSAKSSTNSATKDETADWNTYTNTKYMYSFKHPKDLTISSGVEGLPGNEELRKTETTAVVNVSKGVPEGDLQVYLQVTVVADSKTLEQVKQSLLSDSTAVVTSMSDTTLNNTPALRFKYNDYLYITAVKNGYKYEFYLKDQQNSDKILSTFKFL